MRRGRGFHTLAKDLDRVTHAEEAQRHAFVPVLRLGLAVLMLVAGLVAAMGLGLQQPNLAALIAALVVAGWLGLAIGSNDVANSLGPAYGAGAIGLMPGLMLIALAEIAGASLAGGAVTQRLAVGIIDPAQLAPGPLAQVVMLSALVGAAAWITAATAAGLPVSTSHSIVGGIAGAGIAAFGASSVGWGALAAIATTWMLTPLAAGALAGALVVVLRRNVLEAPDRGRAALRWLPPMVGAMCGLFAAYAMLLARPVTGTALAVPAGAVAALIGAALMRRNLVRELAGGADRGGSKRLFRPPLLVAAAMMGFAHGANDVGNVAGPLSVVLGGGSAAAIAALPTASWSTASLPVAALLLAALAIALGTLMFGRRLVVMVGSGITRLNAARAFCVSLATAVTVLTASAFGLPVSTTHVAVGGVFGVGFAREWLDRRAARNRLPVPAEENRRRLLIRRSHVATITVAWIVTVPVTALLGGLGCRLILWAAAP